MSADDIQIGNTWTDPDHRGRGLAFHALLEVVSLERKKGRNLWYVVGADNPESVHVAEKAGFKLAAMGQWKKPFGFKLFGSYVIAKPADSERINASPLAEKI